jgi:signal transduction histidine kinase
MEDLGLHILDIVENSLSASATRIEILIVEHTCRDILTIEISDNGKGMDAVTQARALDPFFTRRTTRRVGLGIPLLAQAARECDGSLEIESEPGKGTRLKASFRRSHPDRKPLGAILETLRTIMSGRPDLQLRYEHRVDDTIMGFDTEDLRAHCA